MDEQLYIWLLSMATFLFVKPWSKDEIFQALQVKSTLLHETVADLLQRILLGKLVLLEWLLFSEDAASTLLGMGPRPEDIVFGLWNSVYSVIWQIGSFIPLTMHCDETTFLQPQSLCA